MWSALRHVLVGEAEAPPMCRCGHSAMCHWDDWGSCRLIDYVTDDECACTRFVPGFDGNA